MNEIRKCDFHNDLDDTILYAVQMRTDDGKWFIIYQSGYPCVYEEEVERDEQIRKYLDYQERQKKNGLSNNC